MAAKGVALLPAARSADFCITCPVLLPLCLMPDRFFILEGICIDLTPELKVFGNDPWGQRLDILVLVGFREEAYLLLDLQLDVTL